MAEKILDRFKLDGKTALVTGGGQGIGQAYCFALGEAGAKIAVVDINTTVAEETAQALTKKGIEAIAITTDVTKEDEVIKMVKTVIDKWGFLTIGVNNAGMGVWRDALTQDFAEWRKILSLNLDSIFLCSRTEAVEMAKKGYGKIVNTASMSAHISNTPQNQAAYNSSKAGVLHLTRSLAAEWAPKNIRVNSISPGYTKTALVDKLLETPEGKTMLPKWLEKVPMGRMATVEDLQGAVVYLASPASDYATGTDIIIDGGYCCW
ncbi:SDR family NAD(P)-dependent oxidoreductase [Leadbettera azotonutricia]|uniref:2-deoxy-D-gluconate 3-dehydrogenase (2-keto-3-deoxygluconate oxidoreductase) n=1 Tax=Leadbettera azotonutricia (strain ATCC BAA-888 / DSM 13862 / ZAS-9) TaxID=545695 RepID=F5Y738_LEAAZ|nr:glucose 1-dehydrogenase [Leadbettera azotonutricia]AEF82792.1 2-deoxy-D-gluconate 3-dehydrogenase (2-keto-3-deoxygluconate oxidoreductase) [Leadbettera azotonutricia ZAS-9]